MNDKILNGIGLVLDIAGALLMYLNASHPMNFVGIGTNESVKNDLKKKAKEERLTKYGIILLATGFLLQLIAVFI